jgi:hypothetical protein
MPQIKTLTADLEAVIVMWGSQDKGFKSMENGKLKPFIVKGKALR